MLRYSNTNIILLYFILMLKQQIKLFFQKITSKFNTPAYRVIFTTINHNRLLIAINFNANLLAGISEGSGFSLIFIALKVLESDKREDLLNNFLFKNTFLSKIIESLSQGQLFISLIILVILIQLLRNGLEYFGAVTSGYLGAEIQAQMTENIFTQIISFSFPCASSYKVGDLTNYVNQASVTVLNLIRHGNMFALLGIKLIINIIVLIQLKTIFSLITIIIFSFLFLIQRKIIPKIKKLSYKLAIIRANTSKQITEKIQALRIIHTFATQNRAITEIHKIENELVTNLKYQSLLIELTQPLVRIITTISMASILILGFLFVENSTIILPSLITFLILLNSLASHINGIASTTNRLAANSGRLARLEEILFPDDKEFTSSDGHIFKELKEEIKFNKVSLKYSNTTKEALININLRLKKGTTTALIGKSGAGKSSIAHLLIGLYQPTAGEILVDNIKLYEYNPTNWCKHLGVVSQDTFIFNQSILDNIRYGLPEATKQQVIQAARIANAHEFIENLPHTYDTVVGERGYRLSGGQRQRLALARAILKQPEIFILDEATSALDSYSEHLIQDALAQFQDNRTVLVIAHRLSTIVNSDLIIVLEEGRIVESGNHQELLAKKGNYAQYWQLQSL